MQISVDSSRCSAVMLIRCPEFGPEMKISNLLRSMLVLRYSNLLTLAMSFDRDLPCMLTY